MTYNGVSSIVEMEEAAGLATEREKHPHTICSPSQGWQVGHKGRLRSGMSKTEVKSKEMAKQEIKDLTRGDELCHPDWPESHLPAHQPI